MIDKITHDFITYQQRRRKNMPQAVGLKRTIVFFANLALLIVAAWLLSVYLGVWQLILFVFSLISLLIVNNKIDKVSHENVKKKKVKYKKYMKSYLVEEFGFNHSEQYKELSILLKEKANRERVYYNLIPYLAMILSVFIAIVSLFASGNQVLTTQLVQLLILLTTITISINLIVNGIANIFKNSRPEKMLQLSEIIHELAIEKSIQEKKIKTGTRRMKI